MARSMGEAPVDDCLFCKIVAREIPADVVFEDDRFLVFRDINPQAPIHVLLIPKVHIATINDLTSEHCLLVGDLTLLAAEVAEQLGCAEEGYRLVLNCNRGGGQTIFHIHMHLLAGARFTNL